ncbi:MAG: DUF4395 family protein [Dehalococcoidia bacterium]
MALSGTTRRLLETQGFGGIDDDELARAEPWLRLAPALCALIAAAGTALASPTIVLALVPFAVAGALLPMHPFDALYNFVVAPLTHQRRLPANGAPRRFACGVGAVWLSATGAAFLAGMDLTGYVLGGAFVATAGTVALTHFCVPSTIYGAACPRVTRTFRALR